MSGIKISKFGSIRPVVIADNLDNSMATISENTDFSKGTLTPWRTPEFINSKTGNFLFKNNCVTITSLNKCASVVDIKINCGYLISTGLFEYPHIGKITGNDTVDWIRLGFPCNLDAPLITGGTPSPATEVITKTQLRTYAYRLKNKFNLHSNLSDPSNIISLDSQNAITINLPLFFDPSYNVTHIEIFTSETTSDISGDNYIADWFSIGEVPVGTTQFIDNYNELGEMLILDDYEPPPNDLSCLQYWNAGVIAGISENKICFSNKNSYDCFPSQFKYSIHDKPKAIIASSTALFVATDGRPVIIYHDNDCSKKSLHTVKDILTIDQHPIVSIQSAVHHNDHAIWATKDGLLMIAPNGQTKIITSDFYSQSQWRELNPALMIGEVHDGVYYGFTDKIGIRLNLPDNTYAQYQDTNLTTISFPNGLPTALCRGDNDELYIQFADGVYKWNSGNDFLTLTWTSVPFNLPSYVSMTAYKIKSSFSSVNVTHLSDNRIVDNSIVNNNLPQRLPVFNGIDWSVTFKTKAEIKEYHLATSVRDLGLN